MPTTTPFNNLITFSRGSNATVTGPNGLIQWAPSNVVTNSESFDAAAWAKSNVTVYPNQDIGNGTLGPELITNGTFDTNLNGWTNNIGATWDAGTALLTAATVSAQLAQSFTTVIGRTYRIDYQFVSGNFGNSLLRIGTAVNDASVLNLAMSAGVGFFSRFFTATATTTWLTLFVNYPGVSITGAWDNISVKEVTPAAATAPDGTRTADTLITAAATGVVSSYSTSQNVLWNTADTRTVSFYVKSSGLRYAAIGVHNGAGFTTATSFDLQTGSVAASDTHPTYTTLGVASIQNIGGGWYRCAVPITGLDTSAKQPYIVGSSTFGGLYNRDVTGNGTSGILIWGAQLELGSTATTYNPTTVKNLLGFSEAFDNAAWTKAQASIVTGAQANPINGLFNAQKLMENTATNVHRVQQGFTTATGATYTFSCYAKAAERSWVYLYDDAANGFAFFDVANGVKGTIAAGWTSTSITPVGNGWYRISGTATEAAGGAGNQLIGLASANGTSSYTGDGNSGVYIYGAQLSDSASLDPYVPTPGAAPSSTAFYGPRFDFDPVTRAPRGLLVEEQRTNLLTYSDDFSNAVWAKINITVTPNATTAPDGTATADLVTYTGAGLGPRQTASTSPSAKTYSYYVKSSGGSRYFQILTDGSTQSFANFDIQTQTTGTVGTSVSSASVVSVGDGWYRLIMTATDASATSPYVGLVSGLTAGWSTGATTGAFFIYGAQLEAGAFATSYIPTVASTVTRSADVATISGSLFSQWYGQAEGTFVVGAVTTAPTASPIGAAVSDGTTSNRIRMFWAANSHFVVRVADSNVVDIDAGEISQGVVANLAGAYRVNDFAASLNGGTAVADNTGGVPSGQTTMTIGGASPVSSSNILNGHIRSINFIPARAADFQLQALSTQPIVDYFFLQTATGDQLVDGNGDELYSLPIFG